MKFLIERKDMVRRRQVLHIPEFYVGKRRIKSTGFVLAGTGGQL